MISQARQPGWARVLALAALCLLTCAAPLHGQSQKWKFIFVSDSIDATAPDEINTNILAEIACAVTNEQPALVLFGGDLAMYCGYAALQTWTNIMGPVYQAGIPIYSTPGNHELYSRSNFAAVIGPTLPTNGPGGGDFSYSVAYSNALILSVDTFNPLSPRRVNQPWVDSVLATNTRPHVFAFGHALAFKLSHPDSLGDFPAERDAFWNSLSNAHAHIYFCGHDHFYNRTRLDDGDGNPDNDLHQIIAGTAGAPFYSNNLFNGANGIWTPVPSYYEAQNGYVTVEIDGNLVQTTWYHRIGTNTYAPADTFAYSLTPRPLLRFSYSSAGLVLRWYGDDILQAASESSGTYADVPGAASPYVLTNFETTAFYRLRMSGR